MFPGFCMHDPGSIKLVPAAVEALHRADSDRARLFKDREGRDERDAGLQGLRLFHCVRGSRGTQVQPCTRAVSSRAIVRQPPTSTHSIGPGEDESMDRIRMGEVKVNTFTMGSKCRLLSQPNHLREVRHAHRIHILPVDLHFQQMWTHGIRKVFQWVHPSKRTGMFGFSAQSSGLPGSRQDVTNPAQPSM